MHSFGCTVLAIVWLLLVCTFIIGSGAAIRHTSGAASAQSLEGPPLLSASQCKFSWTFNERHEMINVSIWVKYFCRSPHNLQRPTTRANTTAKYKFCARQQLARVNGQWPQSLNGFELSLNTGHGYCKRILLQRCMTTDKQHCFGSYLYRTCCAFRKRLAG